SQYTPFFSKTPAALMVLLQHGEYDKAMTLLNNGTTNVTDFGGETYTAHLDQRLSEWLKAISSEELALYAEALISSAPDTNHEDERADLSRGERLQKLVEKYETFDF